MRRGLRIETFGDGWDVLGLIGSGVVPVSFDAPVLAIGSFRAPERERALDHWGFRRDARSQLTEQVAVHCPGVLVLVVDGTGRRRCDKLALIARSLVVDSAHSAALLSDRDLPVVGAVVRSRHERRLLAKALDRRRYEYVFADDVAAAESIGRRLYLSFRRLGIDTFQGPRYAAEGMSG